jgi:hypothetical protein
MSNAYIEPMPKGDGPAIHYYQIEFSDSTTSLGPYKTQADAIDAAKKMGHKPCVARVRNTNKGNPDHWRAA